MTDDNLDALCAEYRERARQFPITAQILRRIEKDPVAQGHYRFRYGKYFVTIWYETFRMAPRWHATITILEPINEWEYGAMQEALLAIESWTEKDHVEAKEILGVVLGPEIIRDSQDVHVHKGLWSLHWIVKDEKGTHDGQRHADITLATH